MPVPLLCPLVVLQVEFIQGYQANVMEFWEEHGADMATQLPSMTLDAFKYARGLVSHTVTRSASHSNSLMHSHTQSVAHKQPPT